MEADSHFFVALLIIGTSPIGFWLLWVFGGKELYNDMKHTSPMDLARRWGTFSRGQKRFVWLVSILLGPAFVAAGFSVPLLQEKITGIHVELPITFTGVLIGQFVVTHLGLLYLEVLSKRWR